MEDTTGPSRRAVVRAGANAAWAVPVISLASAAPAHAAVSGGGSLGASVVWARYVNGTDPAESRPDRLEVALVVANNGPGDTGDVAVDFAIPSALFTSEPSVYELAGLDSSSVTGTFEDGWVVHLVRTTSIPNGGTPTLVFRIQLNDPVEDSPYRAWAGHSFPYTLTVSSAGFTPAVVQDDVLESVETSLYFSAASGDRVGGLVSMSFDVANGGRKTTGAFALEVSWTSTGVAGDYWASTPASSVSAAGWTGGELSGDGSPGSPWTYAFSRPDAVASQLSGASYNLCIAPFAVSIPLGDGVEESTGGHTIQLKATGEFASQAQTDLPFDIIIGG